MSHYYEQTAEGVQPRHFVPLKKYLSKDYDGPYEREQLRPTRVTDAKKHGWSPSVTTILDVLGKPGLVNWKIDQHLEQAYQINWEDSNLAAENGTPSIWSRDDYFGEVRRRAELQMDKAPSAGSDVHKLLERYFLNELPPGEDWDFCHKVGWEIECETGIKSDDGIGQYTTEFSFVCEEGFGGQVDLILVEPGKPIWLIDYKTKQTKEKFEKKLVYDEHHMQLAAYRAGVKKPARCANVFICIETGEVKFIEHTEDELQRGWQMFQHCFELWKLKHDYEPGVNNESE